MFVGLHLDRFLGLEAIDIDGAGANHLCAYSSKTKAPRLRKRKSCVWVRHTGRPKPATITLSEERRNLMANVGIMHRGDMGAPKVDLSMNRFPYSVVWGPLGPCTCCCPCVGHMGIGDSTGRIHDFAGPYYIGCDDFMVGCVWRYAVLDVDDARAWDAAIERADAVYRERMHNICCDNCHHHAALALTEFGRPQ